MTETHICGKKVFVKFLNKYLPCFRNTGRYHGSHTADLTGQKFGGLTVKRLGKPSITSQGWKSTTWVVEHEDGNKRTTLHATLVRGQFKGRNSFAGFTKGKNGKNCPEYATVYTHHRWIFKPYRAQDLNYKGMPFCDEWNPDKGGAFWKGCKWIIENLGYKPGPEWSLDIIKHELGFVPGNLRWAQKNQQADNKQHRKLGQFTDKEFEVEAHRRGYFKISQVA